LLSITIGIGQAWDYPRMEQYDVQIIIQEQEEIVKRKSAHHDFKGEYVAKAIALKDAKVVPKGKKMKVAELVLPHHIEQKDAKMYLPPAANVHIWRSNTRGEWNSHMPPFKRITCSYIKFGSSELALKQCLKLVWKQYLDARGLPETACTVKGLFS
jgi:hypothetical protein